MRPCFWLFILLRLSLFSQTRPDSIQIIHIRKEQDSSEIFTVTEEPAEFPGGLVALFGYIREIQVGTVAAHCGGCITIRVKFTVETDGSLSNISVQDRDSCFSGLQANTIQVLSSMPVWKPARHLGKIVRSYYTLPLRIRVN